MLFCCCLQGQTSVQFQNISIDQAKERARMEGKLIFVDTYAPWCKPCKKLDPVFRDREVVAILNKDFINVRINADDYTATDFKNKYRVVFLPTLLFLDQEGNIKVKVDKVISKYELLAFADLALHSNEVYNTMVISNNPTVKRASKPVEVPTGTIVTAPPPAPKTSTQPTTKAPVRKKPNSTNSTVKPEEKILYVLDEALDAPPEILYQEAYFRMQLMDGSHWDVANQYLSTQYDWGTEKNMRFIFDFLKDTDTDDFKYFIDNRMEFEKLLNKKQVDITIEILVETKLTQGYPRPDLAKAIQLYGYIDPTNKIEKAYKYSIARSYEEKKYKEFERYCEQYFPSFEETADLNIMHLYAAFLEYQYSSKEMMVKAEQCMKKCVVKDNTNPAFFNTLARIYFKLKDKPKAVAAAQKGIALSQNQNVAHHELMQLMEQIEQL